MDHNPAAVEVDSHELAKAEAFWHHFVLATKVCIGAIVVLLCVMALFLL